MDTSIQDQPAITALFSSFAQAWNAHDIKGIAAVLHPSATYITPTVPEPLKGDAITQLLQSMLDGMPDSKIEVLMEATVGAHQHVSQILAKGTWTKPFQTGNLAGMAPSEKPTSIPCAFFMEEKDGKIFKCTQYYDRVALLTQLGVMKSA